MKSYEIYTCRRKALGLSMKEFADEVGVREEFVLDFERGERIPTAVYLRIKNTMRYLFNSLSPFEHYQKRIIELAMELEKEDDKNIALQMTSHMMIELGKLQNEILGIQLNTKEDWA